MLRVMNTGAGKIRWRHEVDRSKEATIAHGQSVNRLAGVVLPTPDSTLPPKQSVGRDTEAFVPKLDALPRS